MTWPNLISEHNNLFVNKIIGEYTNAIILEHKKRAFDIINVQHLVVAPLIGINIKHLTGVPLVVTCHGSDIYELSRLKYNNRFFLIQSCDAIICVSREVKNSLLLIYNKAKNYKKIFIIPPGVNRKIFTNLNLIREKKVLFVGRLIKEKGIDQAIKVFFSATSVKNLSDYKLFIAGEGKLKTKLEKKYNNFIKAGRLIFLGGVSQKRLATIFNKSKILIFTSIWREPFGMVIIESFSTGTPVIANNVGCINKIISTSSGIIIPRNNWKVFASSLRKILLNERKLNYFSKNAIKNSKKYDWDKIVNKIINVYESVIY